MRVTSSCGVRSRALVSAKHSKKPVRSGAGARGRSAGASTLDARAGHIDPARLVFVDETAANTEMMRLCGRCPRGERLIGRVPQGHWKTMTFVAALRRNGMRAPCTVDGAMNGTKFLAYVKQCLPPTLKRRNGLQVLAVAAPARHPRPARTTALADC
jgi:DDE superfamily endonuclease